MRTNFSSALVAGTLAAAALPRAIVSAHSPPVKWKMLMPVKERAAALTVWSVRCGVPGCRGGDELELREEKREWG